MIKILIAIVGGIMNRVRGSGYKYHTESNIIVYGLTMGLYYGIAVGLYSLPVWLGCILISLIMALCMWAGQATGWTEMLHAGKGSFELDPIREDYSWMSKRWYAWDFKNFGVFKPTNQWNAWAFGWLRGMIWAVPIFLGLLACGILNFWLLLFPVLFYPCYRLSYLVRPKGYFGDAEVVAGIVLWFLSVLGIK